MEVVEEEGYGINVIILTMATKSNRNLKLKSTHLSSMPVKIKNRQFSYFQQCKMQLYCSKVSQILRTPQV